MSVSDMVKFPAYLTVLSSHMYKFYNFLVILITKSGAYPTNTYQIPKEN